MEYVAVLTRADGSIFHVHMSSMGHVEELTAALDGGSVFDASPCSCLPMGRMAADVINYDRAPSMAGVARSRVWGKQTGSAGVVSLARVFLLAAERERAFPLPPTAP